MVWTVSKRQTLEQFQIGLKATQYLSSTVDEEQYKQLVFNSNNIFKETKQTKIVVTSLSEKNKLSFFVENLAIMFAKSGQQVLLVDSNLTQPTLYRKFGVTNNPGLINLMKDSQAELKELIRQTDIPKLSLLTAGVDNEIRQTLNADALDEIIKRLEKEFDLIIFATPSLETVLPTQILAAKTDGVILSVEERVTTKESFISMQQALAFTETPVVSVVYCQ